VNLGRPMRIIEVEPIAVPLPDREAPLPEPAEQPDPRQVPEPIDPVRP
jgi:hypothetical protein